jgi:hypothetical protein
MGNKPSTMQDRGAIVRRIRLYSMTPAFWLGALLGVLATILVLVIGVRLITRGPAIVAPVPSSGLPDLTLTLSRELLERVIDDGLRDVRIPLVTIRDPMISLEPDGIIVVRLRGDTALLGAQVITLRTRLVPSADGVAVVTEAADVRGLGNVAGPITQQLDQQINAELARRLPFGQQFEVLRIDGTTTEIAIDARLRE